MSRELRGQAPLVDLESCWALRLRLAAAALGRATVVQAGDCAEMFSEVSAENTRRKQAQLQQLGLIVEQHAGQSPVLIGRMAGQFAKPRSCAFEPAADGRPLAVYRGDAVNGAEPDASARVADPRRMLTAYARASQVLQHLAAAGGPQVWVSHEALLPEYEAPLIRRDPERGGRYAASGHLLWVGERTRAVGGPQVRLLSGVLNPIGVKLGPSATAAEVVELVETLDPMRQPGRLVLIPRLGSQRVREVLPGLVEAARRAGARPVWLCDPMHANTVKLADGRKTRAMADIVEETRGFVDVLHGLGEHPAGLHLETTPYAVTECVELRSQLDRPVLPRYASSCDPRLDPDQSRRVVHAFVRARAEKVVAA